MGPLTLVGVREEDQIHPLPCPIRGCRHQLWLGTGRMVKLVGHSACSTGYDTWYASHIGKAVQSCNGLQQRGVHRHTGGVMLSHTARRLTILTTSCLMSIIPIERSPAPGLSTGVEALTDVVKHILMTLLYRSRSMGSPPLGMLSFELLHSAMSLDVQRSVIKRALTFAQSGPTDACRALRRALRRLRVDGYKHADRAPIPMVLPAILDSVQQTHSNWRAVLPVWLESQATLLNTAKGFLAGKGIEAEAPDLSDGFPAIWTIAEMEQVVDEFLAQYPDVDRGDAALMLCCLTGRTPLTEDMRERLAQQLPPGTSGAGSEARMAEQCIPAAWQAWLGELRQLPADAPEWAQAPALVSAIQAIAEEKRHEREAARNRLRAAIAALIDEAGEQLQYFQFADVPGWSADGCALQKAIELAGQVDALRALLVEHRGLLQAPVSTMVERQQRESECSRLEQRIVELHDRLSDDLGTPGPPDEPPTGLPDVTDPSEGDSLPGPAGSTPGKAPTAAAEASPQPGPPVGEAHPPAGPTAPSRAPESPPAEADEHGPEAERPVPSEPTGQPGGDDGPAEEAAPGAEGPAGEPQPGGEEAAPIEPLAPPLELCSSAQAAACRSQGSADNWRRFLSALIAEDDLSGAYWLARSLASSSHPLAVPGWLLAAVQGSRWLSSDLDAFSAGLLDIAKNHAPGDGDAEAMLALAAALRPALIAPASGLASWLSVPDCCQPVRNLVNAIDRFAKLGVPLHLRHLQGAAGMEQRGRAIQTAVNEAAHWLREAPLRKPKFKRAADVWRYLIAADGEIGAMLSLVSRDDRDSVERVEQTLRQWRQRDHVLAQIVAIDLELAGKKKRRIDGDAREHITRGVEDACNIAANWCDLVEGERDLSVRGDWLLDRVTQLRDDIKACLPEAEDAVASLAGAPADVLSGAAAICLQRSIRELAEYLGLAPTADPPQPAVRSSWQWLAAGATSLGAALNRRLLLLPETPITDEMAPAEGAIAAIADALCTASAERRTARTAFTLWLQRQDYRFLEMLLGSPELQSDAAELARSHQEALIGSRVSLRENKNRTVSEIEQSLLDGVIGEEERSEYLARVDKIREDDAVNFAPRYHELDGVREWLAEARRKRLAEVQTRWQGLALRLATSDVKDPEQEAIRRTVTAALDRGDVRVADEHLARLEEALDTGRELEGCLLAPAEARDPLVEFKRAVDNIELWLEQARSLQPVIDGIRDGQARDGLSLILPKPRLREAAEAVDGWRRLKRRGLTRREMCQCVQTVLRYLGFSFDSRDPNPVQVAQSGADWAHLRATMSASDLARPIPQFGSLAQQRYDIVCFRERPSADMMAARLRELRLTTRAVLVFYLARLKERQRLDVMRMSHDRELALAVLDETLLVFLAHEHDSRMPAFLRCALPYGALNPYTPFQAGDVPPEMFYGREAMAHDLQLPAGSCLVYGGRQLGKSALLRHVQRLFHLPEREQYAWIENMKLVFEPRGGKGADNVWCVLRDGFRRKGLLPARTGADRPEQIRRLLLDVMRASPERRVLVMFDEADEFLDADASARFKVVTGLRELMLETQRRFKVVFAGLHNVQRFQGIPDQPLAHFGTPICVGPLDAVAAEKLVREPLETLGYRFSDGDGNATVLRILSYTNYHPGLIQLFCHELLQALHRRAATEPPPYAIQQSDVEAVYRQPDVRLRIRERLDWTLALDMRYQAIAWTMIVDQMGAHDSYAAPYTAGDILEAVRDWWPAGFANVSIEQLRGGVLEEMVGLGILVRNADGHYRLRSPNLVRLMGTEDDIEHDLLALHDREPPKPSDSDSHHASLGREGHRYSPLTYAQERSLTPARSGVSLVFASQAQGAPELPQAFKRFAPEGPDGDIIWHDPPAWIIDGDTLSKWLDTRLEGSSRLKRLVFFYQPTTHRPGELERLVRQALEFCVRQRPQGPLVRILLAFDPPATWAWLSLPEEIRMELEDRVDAAVFPQQWDRVGVQQRLAQEDKLGSDDVWRRVLEVTGGWHTLLDTLFDRSAKHSDPRRYVDKMEQELSDPGSELARQFRRLLGLEGRDEAQRVLRLIVREQEVPEDLPLAGFVGGEPHLDEVVCRRALAFLVRMGCVAVRDGVATPDRVVQRVFVQP